MKIDTVKIREHGDARDLLASICAGFAARIAADPELVCDPSWPPVRLILSGDEEANRWASEEAVGFFAVMVVDEIDEDGQPWFEVNENLDAHVNLDLGLRLLSEHGFDPADLESWLATVPHELLHVRDWMEETGGRTPLQAYDDGQGELSIREVHRAIDRKYADAEDETEDAVERAALAITRRVVGWPELEDACERLREAANAYLPARA